MKFLKRWKTRILLFFAVVGPGFITANVDNDAGGICTYSSAGAQFGHLLLWTMIPITLALIVVQEMCARMGAVTGKGLSDLIREEFGFRITFFMMIGILIINFGNVVAEFAGIAGSLELFGLSKYITVPICAVIVWLIVVKGQYKSVEKVFLVASFFYITYIFAGVLAKPAWIDALVSDRQTAAQRRVPPAGYLYHGDRRGRNHDRSVDAVLPAVFDRGEGRHQAAIQSVATRRDRRLYLHRHRRLVHHRGLRGDAVCPRLPQHLGRQGRGPGAASLAGDYAYILFAVGLFNASLFAASILPLSTAYTVCEGLGFESGVGKKFSEAPVFYWLYTMLIVAGAGVHPDSRAAAGQNRHPVPGGERRRASFRAGLHAAAGQQERTDGRVRQLVDLQHRRLDYYCGDDPFDLGLVLDPEVGIGLEAGRDALETLVSSLDNSSVPPRFCL